MNILKWFRKQKQVYDESSEAFLTMQFYLKKFKEENKFYFEQIKNREVKNETKQTVENQN